MSVADALAPLTVLDLSGKPVSLGSLWSAGPVLLVCIRHYG